MRLHTPPLVGRDDEFRAVRRFLDATGRGRGGVLFLVGPSGIGKSRLLNSASDAAFTSGMALMRGRASTLDQMMPFRPLAEALLSLLRVTPLDPAELGPYGPILGRLVPDWNVPGVSREDDLLVVLAEAVVRLTQLAGGDRGCVVALDDMQNADPETLAVLEYLIDNVEHQPTVVLGAIANGEDSAALDLARSAEQRGRATVVKLEPLAHAEIAALVAGCLDISPADVPVGVVDLLLAGGGGNPCMTEDMVADMVDGTYLVGVSGRWRLSDSVPAAVATTLARPIGGRLTQLPAQLRESLSVAAMFGARFPLEILRHVMAIDDHELLRLLQADGAAHFVRPDEQRADWYAFRHELTWKGVREQLPEAERVRLAGVVADTVESLHPGLDGEWCQAVATLRRVEGDRARAGELIAELGRRARVLGAARSAVSLLDQAWRLLADANVEIRARTLETLVLALVEAGSVKRAIAAAAELDQIGEVAVRRKAVVHTKAAWAAMIAGHTEDGLTHVDAARRQLGPDADAADLAEVDVVAAHLALDLPGAEQLAIAERLARDAARVAESVPLPEVACQAWQLLGAVTRPRDPTEATRCLEHALTLAERHDLPIWRMHALIRLGNDDALRDGDLDRLTQARDRATDLGAVTAQCQAEASIALHAILRGEFDDATACVDRVLATTVPMQLVEITQYVLLLRAVLAGHRGRRAELEAALAGLERGGGDLARHWPRVHGLAKVFCALLEERREQAMVDMDAAEASHVSSSSVYHLSGQFGMRPLLRALAGESDLDELTRLVAGPASGLRWDRQFASFARAVHLGRTGRPGEATAAVGEALRLGEPFVMGRHLGLRLVGEAAMGDDWGEPVEWLRAAESYFRRLEVTPVVDACRTLLRRAGVRVLQHRAGADRIPAELRLRGVTAREFEVLRLLVDRLGNREIADHLHLSPRTVERHVSSLLAKTGLPDRIALGRLATEHVNR